MKNKLIFAIALVLVVVFCGFGVLAGKRITHEFARQVTTWQATP